MDASKGTAVKESSRKGSGSKSEKERKTLSLAQHPPAKAQTAELQAIPVDEVSSLKEQLRQEQEKSKEYLSKLLYAQADFENYRKRLNQEIDSRVEAEKSRLIQKLLTIVDELELAIKAAEQVRNASGVVTGLEVVSKKFRELLTAEGLTPIETAGKKFDPALHEAVERVPRDDSEEGTILEEIRGGFTLRGKLIRPSIVKIAVPHIAESDRSDKSGSESV